MPTLLNDENVGVKVFKDYHPNVANDRECEEFVAPSVSSDEGKMDPELSKRADSLVMAAKQFKYGKVRHYQWSTKNKSFIQLHNDLKQLGIKNNKFFLRLYDTELEGVDYFNPFMPLEMQARVFRECVVNPWFYLREICRVPVDGKPIAPGGGTAFAIDRNSAASWLLFLNGISHFCSKPRQKGKTIDALSKVNYAYHFGSLAGSFTFGNKDFQLNKMNLARLKTMRDLLPSYLQMKIAINTETLKVDKGTENVTMMKNPITKNSIILLPTASTGDKADGIGRGYTAALQFWDEFEWMPHNTRVLKAAAPAYRTAADNAKANGSVYCRIFTSTPGNLDSPAGQTAEEFIHGNKYSKGMLIWEDKMFDTPMQKIKAMAESASYNGVVFVEHSWQQLKCTMKWYEDQCQGVGFDPEQIAREIQLKRLRGTSKSPFSRVEIMNLINGIYPSVDSIDLSENMAPIYFYEKLNRRTPYIIGVDTAEGLSGDNTTMIVINPYTEKIAAEFKSPFIRQDKMGKMIIEFMTRYCPRALIIVENNRGRECMHIIQDSVFGGQLWYDIDNFGDTEKINKKDPNWNRERALGFNTSRKTRPILMDTLEAMVKEEPEKINGKFVVDDICALEKSTSGKIQAASGKHDDCVMAYLIAITVFRHATNLDEWGIYHGMRQPTDDNTPESKAKRIMEMISSLPAELRKMFTPADKNPVSDAFEFAKEVQKGLINAEIQNTNPIQAFYEDDNTSYHSALQSQANDDAYIDSILSMNGMIDDTTKNFDIDDYF